MQLGTDWATLKAFAVARGVSIQYVTTPDTYYLFAIDGQAELDSQISITSPAGSDQSDFETNFKSTGNQSPNTVVTTQFEFNNKDLKLASMSAELPNDGSTITATASICVPGTFGYGDGRFIAGGYGISEDYNKDDKALCWVSDDDRKIAWMIALAMNPSATAPLPDATIQEMGVLPSPIGFAMPNYPIVKTYHDDAVPTANQGWYFWANAQGNSLNPIGEIEIEPIAGYAFIPSGMYLKIQYVRPAGVFTGGIRINLDWGKTGTVGSI